VRVLHLRGQTDPEQEPRGPEDHSELGAEHLQRDRAVVLEIAREVDGSNPAATDLALDRVPAREGYLEGGRGSATGRSSSERGLYRGAHPLGRPAPGLLVRGSQVLGVLL